MVSVYGLRAISALTFWLTIDYRKCEFFSLEFFVSLILNSGIDAAWDFL